MEARRTVEPGRGEPQATQAEGAGTAPPAELAARPLFEPLRGVLEALGGAGPCELGPLNTLATHTLGRGEVRFVPPDPMDIVYEERIATRGEVVTRPGNWHDFFNALVWLRFPQSKRCLARLHVEGMGAQAPGGQRGPLRDAATQFDESGVIVAASDADLIGLLAQRRWKELFWNRRSEVIADMRFLVFGHGLYDALRAPFYRICGRAAAVVVPRSVLEADVGRLCASVDAIVAQRFAERVWYPRPKSLLALPLLGIPGVCAGSERAEYYDDTLQFRPPP